MSFCFSHIGYFILLNKLTGQNDIIVGTVAAGRRIKEVENVIGDFLNFMAIRCIVEEDYQVQEFLEEIKSHVLSAYENQEYPIEQVIDELNIQCEKNRSSLYDTMFITQNIKMPDYELNGLKVSPYHLNKSMQNLIYPLMRKKPVREYSFVWNIKKICLGKRQ